MIFAVFLSGLFLGINRNDDIAHRRWYQQFWRVKQRGVLIHQIIGHVSKVLFSQTADEEGAEDGNLRSHI